MQLSACMMACSSGCAYSYWGESSIATTILQCQRQGQTYVHTVPCCCWATAASCTAMILTDLHASLLLQQSSNVSCWGCKYAMIHSNAESECTLLSTAVSFLCISAGLLLNNLSVYHGCEIVFDSSEVPDQAMAVATDVPDVQVGITAADHAYASTFTILFSF